MSRRKPVSGHEKAMLREYHRNYMAKWRAENREVVLATTYAWRKANPELHRAHQAAWYERHRDAQLAKRRARYAAKRDEEKRLAALRKAAGPPKEVVRNRLAIMGVWADE
jgi:ABC-type nitrate/sulfonate/bicarbonate transport system substrate-binding protein